MFILRFSALILLCGHALASNYRIHSVTPDFIKFEDGSVGHFSADKTRTFVKFFLRPGQDVLVRLNEQNEIESILPRFSFGEPDADLSDEISGMGFTPTVLPNYKAAANLLKTFRSNDLTDSQCYDRAHVWAYEAQSVNNIELGKTWMFFADHYIKKNKFKWWFHIAPVAKVSVNGVVEDRILDREFSIQPLQLKIWSDMFMLQKQACKTVEFYSEYSQHPGEDDCYFIHSSPFFWQPKDLEQFAESGLEKQNYFNWELRHAYEHAFGLKTNF